MQKACNDTKKKIECIHCPISGYKCTYFRHHRVHGHTIHGHSILHGLLLGVLLEQGQHVLHNRPLNRIQHILHIHSQGSSSYTVYQQRQLLFAKFSLPQTKWMSKNIERVAWAQNKGHFSSQHFWKPVFILLNWPYLWISIFYFLEFTYKPLTVISR